ncbi:MAG: hypothetical protein RID09_30470 [Coleofasciculus sp. G1-WW12-02]|uniref:hypothetical protein n=1 Tax=unclassified Coleofasciculus TaxID=2692782 RepID=UPI0032F7EAC5
MDSLTLADKLKTLVGTPTKNRDQGTKQNYCLWKTGGCLWTLSKTITGFSSGLSALLKVPNVASADETGNLEDE